MIHAMPRCFPVSTLFPSDKKKESGYAELGRDRPYLDSFRGTV